MHRIRKKLTYANVMSSLAVFLVLGGASAFAASQLGKNSVGTKQLKNNAVTTTKLKRNAVTATKIRAGAITTAKIKNGSVTAAKLKAGAIAAGQLGANSVGNSQTQLVKVFKAGAVPAAADAASAPRIELGTVGPFKFYATCARAGEFIEERTFIELTTGSAILTGAPIKQEFGYLTPGSSAEQKLLDASVAKDGSFARSVNPGIQASASDGTQIVATAAGGAKAGAPAEGNGPFLAGDSCIVGPLAVFGG